MMTAPELRSEWIHCLAVVLFDLDIGHQLEQCYPRDALSVAEQGDVAFHAFPDSMSMELHSCSSVRDSTFFFRMWRRGIPQPVAEESKVVAEAVEAAEHPEQLGHDAALATVPWQGIDEDAAVPNPQLVDAAEGSSQPGSVLYGFVFCRQRQDERLRRGGEQKSLVVLSELPFSSVLGIETLEWDEPLPSQRCLVSLGQNSFTAPLPPAGTLPQPAPPLHEEEALAEPTWMDIARMPGSPETLSSMQGVFHEADIFSPVRTYLERLWSLWEMMLLAKPIMVVAPTPGDCSATVGALISLITPVPYAADFRPYFTIHDPAFQAMADAQVPTKGSKLPRLLGALPPWPSVLSVGTKPSRSDTGGSGTAGANGSDEGDPSRLGRLNPANALRAVRRRTPQCLLSEHCLALWTDHRPTCTPDRALMSRLMKIMPADAPSKLARIGLANSTALRRHFVELTRAVLEPFSPYCRGNGPPPGQANCVAFYRQFLESPNFMCWFERQRKAAWDWQEAAWRLASAERGTTESLTPLAEQMGDVEMVQALDELESELRDANEVAYHPGAAPTARMKVLTLQQQISGLYKAMPRDLKQLLLSSPQRAAVLQASDPDWQAFNPDAVNANGSPQHGRGVIAAATSMLARHYEQGPSHSSPSTPISQMLP
eukprot:jgi/Astpho2/2409/Aster-x1074